MRVYLLVVAPIVVAVVLLSFLAVFYASQLFPTHDAEQLKLHRNIMEYLNIPFHAPETEIAFLSDSEREHMRDVKRVFDGAFIVTIACFVFSGTVLRKLEERRRRVVGRRAVWALFGVCGVMLLLGVAAGFSNLWTWFHLVIFPQGNWQFAADSMLITLYPLGYFRTLAVAILLLVLAIATLFLITMDVDELPDVPEDTPAEQFKPEEINDNPGDEILLPPGSG